MGLAENLMAPAAGHPAASDLFFVGDDLRFVKLNIIDKKLPNPVVTQVLENSRPGGHPWAAASATPVACAGESAPVWFVEALVKDSDFLEPQLFIISNARTIATNDEGELCTRIGPARAFVPNDLGESLELGDLKSYKGEIARLGSRWGEQNGEPDAIHVALRSRYESGRVKVPVLGLDINAHSAMFGLSIVGLSLLAWTSFLLRLLACSFPTDLANFWLLVTALGTMPKRGSGRVIAILEMVLFCLYVGIGLFCPLILSLLSWLVPGPASPNWIAWAQAVVFSLSIVFLLSSIQSYIVVLRTVRSR